MIEILEKKIQRERREEGEKFLHVFKKQFILFYNSYFIVGENVEIHSTFKIVFKYTKSVNLFCIASKN